MGGAGAGARAGRCVGSCVYSGEGIEREEGGMKMEVGIWDEAVHCLFACLWREVKKRRGGMKWNETK